MADANINFNTELDSSNFTKGLNLMESKLVNMKRSLVSVASATNNAFGKNSQKGVEVLSQRLSKQLEVIDSTKFKLTELNGEYASLMSGDTQPKSLIAMKKELADINKMIAIELESNNRLIDQYIMMERIKKGSGDKNTKLVGNIDESSGKLQEATSKAKLLSKTINEVSMNPALSLEAGKLSNAIELTSNKMTRLTGAAEITRSKISEALSTNQPSMWSKIMDKASASAKKVSNSVRGVGKSAKSSSGLLVTMTAKLTRMAKAMFFYNIIRGSMRAITTHIKDLVSSNEVLLASLNQVKFNLKVAFQPIWDTILPYLQTFVNWLTQATQQLGKFMAAVTGKSFESSKAAVKALDNQKKAYDKVGNAAKKASKSTQGFDQLNKLQAEDNGVDEINVPEIKEVKVDQSAIISKMKDTATKIFEVFKKAWDVEGVNTIESMKRSLSSILELTKSIGKSFMEVWTNGTGQEMLETMLRIVQNISDIIGNFADSFREAWEENETGTRIIQALADTIQIVLDLIDDLTLRIADWISSLDLSPLLESFAGFGESANEVLKKVSEVILWLWDEVLEPVLTWAIEELGPALFDLGTALNDLAVIVMDAIGPSFQWFLDTVLKPIGSFLGEQLIKFIGWVTEKLEKMGEWIKENEKLVTAIMKPLLVIISLVLAIKVGVLLAAKVVGVFIKGFLGILKVIGAVGKVVGAIGKVVLFLKKIITVIGVAAKAVIAFITMPAVLIPIAIALVVALLAGLVYLVIKHWDKIKEFGAKIWEGIKTFFSNLSEGFTEIIDSIVSAVSEFLSNIVENIKEGISTFISWVGTKKDELVEKISSAFDSVKEKLTSIGDWIKKVFSVLWGDNFDSMKDKVDIIIEGIKGTIDGLKTIFGGIIKFIKGVFSGDWEMAWEGVKEIFSGVMSTLASVVKTPINLIITMFNGLIEKIYNVINLLGKGFKAMSFDIPDWVPKIGGNSFGINIPELTAPKIPMLAKGGLIPPRKPRTVIVGDNNYEDEIVSPVSTMEKAVQNAILSMGGIGGNNQETNNLLKQLISVMTKGHVIELDGREFGRSVVDTVNNDRMRTGNSLL